ncbi:hypothetical protein A7P25_01820 [Achromobacter xylosoxidans]|uniref:Preprotein translocase subunit SecD n=1 Tax=Achromobacter ruhlandii TaxID=72557 RepID=A0A2M9GSE0_9BURK|nr:hypothetical protein [Achromobacter ruhlandii]ALX84549.1 preprotein translocase subunit SecD [Achromobacter denitrificans]AMG46479.1 hypothetical protein AL520_20775 [Achromobacter xylosoxidans]MCV6798388.1 hypothetical protein [Achromobacter ruhlandii]MCV6803818.1 hypothetical protein [Achromobacter ruhlandii]MCV6810147.1 hypothetical protein [Achromobacter ruhlandii]
MKAQDVLPDDRDSADFQGVTVRKGTVGAFLANARLWCDAGATPRARELAGADLREALPALRALGLFEVLEVRDAALRQWLEAAY